MMSNWMASPTAFVVAATYTEDHGLVVGAMELVEVVLRQARDALGLEIGREADLDRQLLFDHLSESRFTLLVGEALAPATSEPRIRINQPTNQEARMTQSIRAELQHLLLATDTASEQRHSHDRDTHTHTAMTYQGLCIVDDLGNVQRDAEVVGSSELERWTMRRERADVRVARVVDADDDAASMCVR